MRLHFVICAASKCICLSWRSSNRHSLALDVKFSSWTGLGGLTCRRRHRHNIPNGYSGTLQRTAQHTNRLKWWAIPTSNEGKMVCNFQQQQRILRAHTQTSPLNAFPHSKGLSRLILTISVVWSIWWNGRAAFASAPKQQKAQMNLVAAFCSFCGKVLCVNRSLPTVNWLLISSVFILLEVNSECDQLNSVINHFLN